MTAAEVKDALRRRHPALDPYGFVGCWTVIEEWQRIDLLAVSAWASARPFPRYARVGYEVKVSRSDYRRELAKPGKRSAAVGFCHEFYFAVPHGLLRPEEISWVPPWGFDQEPQPLAAPACPGAWGAPCVGGRVAFGRVDRRPPGQRQGRLARYRTAGLDVSRRYEAECPTCRGAGTVGDPPAARAGAPALWVPDDVGLVVVSPTGRCTVAKKAPRRQPRGVAGDALLAHVAPAGDGAGIHMTDWQLAELVRWISVRPDPRHAAARRP